MSANQECLKRLGRGFQRLWALPAANVQALTLFRISCDVCFVRSTRPQRNKEESIVGPHRQHPGLQQANPSIGVRFHASVCLSIGSKGLSFDWKVPLFVFVAVLSKHLDLVLYLQRALPVPTPAQAKLAGVSLENEEKGMP